MKEIASALYPWVVSGLGGFLGALFLLPTRLFEIVLRARVDRLLDASKHVLQRELEQLKGDIKSRDEQIASVRSIALSGLATRTEVLTKRRLQAVEVIWASILEYKRYRPLVEMTRAIKMKEAMEGAATQTSDGERVRTFAKTLVEMNKIGSLKFEARPDREQIYVSPDVWARFSVYRSVMTLPVTKIFAMQQGVRSDFIKSQKPLLAAAKSVLPHMSEFIDEHGEEGLSYLHDLFEEEVLKAIVAGFSDAQPDANSVKQAVSIIQNVNRASIDAPDDNAENIEVPTSIRGNPLPDPRKS
jgi:hypothetical protein